MCYNFGHMAKELPDLFVERLSSIVPVAQLPEILESFNPNRKSFRINTLKTTLQQGYAKLKEQGFSPQAVPWFEAAFVLDLESAQKLLENPIVSEGLVYAQGLESMLSVVVLGPKPGERVLDLCAAPGSKTSLIAALMENQGTLIANEPVRARFYRLKAVTSLLGAHAQWAAVDGRRYQARDGLFDRVLVDAPCSSEGRFKINDEKSFGYWSTRKIKEMSHKQKGILLNATRCLKPDGVLVYSTCTFAPEENEEVVDWLLRKSDGTVIIESIHSLPVPSYPCLTSWQKQTFAPAVKQALRVLPGEGRSGFFIAKFKHV